MKKGHYRVLVADQEERIRHLIRAHLEKDAILEEADTCEKAIMLALDKQYDLIIMDGMLPGIGGIEACRMIRDFKSTPMLIVSDKAGERDRIEGFQAGADDYVTKPFSPKEFVLRIRALLKRTSPERFWQQEPVLRNQFLRPRLVIEHYARRVLVAGKEMSLTLKEYELLHYLAMHIGKVCSRELLLQEVWQRDSEADERIVDTHVKRLREKMNFLSPGCDLIKTIWGLGYRLEDQPLQSPGVQPCS
ncbi:response regulator transcription factor [Paenibacillus whitsoniae]|uniref:Response regulator transcription factor n=1 Tax=Paenibacillus whitsoniae TaxID=2496558 RepID=A0A430JIW2_9BACL|nr:response regulator transcription factor [Paenibacillus whitsoniae]RTE11001.1 response regulator transcription factor [Paenibacillus whitsoniae]